MVAIFTSKSSRSAVYGVSLLIACLFIALLVHRYKHDVLTYREDYISLSSEQAGQAAKRIEDVFSKIYSGIRTMARLPSVREIDRHAENFKQDGRTTVQEIYNNLASSVSLSEVYIVPLDFNPGKVDRLTGKLEIPIITYDEVIVGRTAKSDTAHTSDQLERDEFPEEEIYEYREMTNQLAWFKEHFPTEKYITGLNYPALISKKVITCDNTRLDPNSPNDEARSGIIYSVPFYDVTGNLKGMISAVILNWALIDYLASGDLVISAINNSFDIYPLKDGQAQASVAAITNRVPDTSLIYSEVIPLNILDGKKWQLWSGRNDRNFWNKPEIIELKNNFAISFAMVLGVAMTFLLITHFVSRASIAELRSKEKLEDLVAERTMELEVAFMQAKKSEELARAASKAKSEFLANMSHEIRTPLNGMLGMTQLLKDTELNSDQKDLAYTISQSGEMLLTILNDILDFSKIEAGKLDISPVPTDLVQSIGQVTQLMLGQASTKNLEVLYHHTDDIPKSVWIDEQRLRQVVTNLLSNAIKFTPKHGAVILNMFCDSITDEHVELHIAVSDSGIGISENAIKLIFEAFTQADSSTTRKYGGTGLGLTISARLVELMGGRIWVESKEGIGSSFHLVIRCKILHTKARSDGEKAIVNNRILPELNILLAEDNLVNQKLAIRLLEKHGFKVTVANNGLEALSCIVDEKAAVDLVLMDCHMPEMDGFEATAMIRKSEADNLNKIPIIALTANAINGDKERCLAAGMDGYVSKPIRQELLFDEIHRVYTKYKTV